MIVIQTGGDTIKSQARSPERLHFGNYPDLPAIAAKLFSSWHL
jgi:hypothetical protein